MSETFASFTGSIPAIYDRYLRPILFESYAIDMAARVAALHPKQVLETAAGTGAVSRHLRRLLPVDAAITVTDLNADMVNFAQEQLGALPNLAFQAVDASKPLPFPDSSFDVVVCQYGVAFYADKVLAMNEVRRVLKPGGTFLFSVWDSYEYCDYVRILTTTLPELFADHQTFFDIPYRWYSLDIIKTLLESTGFHSIEFSLVTHPSLCADASDIVVGYLTGTPFSLELAKRPDFKLDEAVTHATEAIIRAYGNPPVGAKNQGIIVKAIPGN